MMPGTIDPALIEEVTVIPGPYGLRYGPGLAFIDVRTTATPRYADGYEAHNRIGISYRTNGEQVYGRETVYGGSANWGLQASIRPLLDCKIAIFRKFFDSRLLGEISRDSRNRQ